ncbi:MAG: hypothetical protein ACOYB2_03720 [Limnohabitans sp.]
MNSKYKFPCGVLFSLALSLLVGCGGGGGGGAGGTPTTPAAEPLKGFQTNTQTVISLTSSLQFNSLSGDPAVYNNQLLLPDYQWGKIFVLNGVPTSNTLADFSSSPALTYSTLPGSIVFYGNTMVMTDMDPTTPGHILIWRDISSAASNLSTLAAPDDVIGSNGCSQSNLNAPQSISVVNGNLVVADTNNHRVMVYKGIPVTGDKAVLVLGQSDLAGAKYDGCQENNLDSNVIAHYESGLSFPADIAYDGTNLIVADSGNNRVLMWNWSDISAAINQQSTSQNTPFSGALTPNKVLGRTDLTNSPSNTSTISLNNPQALSVIQSNVLGAVRLAVADTGSNRVLIWDAVPTCTPINPASACEAISAPNKDPIPLPVVGNVQGLHFTGINQLVMAIDNAINSHYVIVNATKP